MAVDETPRIALSRGTILKCVRKVFRQSPTEGTHLSQVRLFELCQNVENSLPSSENKKYFTRMKSADIKNISKKIRPIENDDDRINEYHFRIVSLALGLDEGFFNENLFYSEDDVSKMFVKGIYTPRARQKMERFINFKKVDENEFLSINRRSLLSEISRNIRMSTKNVALIEGNSAIGKSYLISAWMQSCIDERNIHALRVDCKDKFNEIIMSEIESYYSRLISQNILFSEYKRIIIVLDGWYSEDFMEYNIATPSSRMRSSISELIRETTQILKDEENVSIFIAIEGREENSLARDIKRDLPNGFEFSTYFLRPLSDADGVQFLKSILPSHKAAREDILLHVSNKLKGLPLALAIAAGEMRNLNERAFERYSPDLVGEDSSHINSKGGEFFLGYLDRLRKSEAGDPEHISHPLALLRLLSLMPTTISEGDVVELIGKGRISRLSPHTDICEMARILPFVSVVNNVFDVHALMKNIVRAELKGIIEKLKNNIIHGGVLSIDYVTLEEVSWIHWQRLKYHWRMIKTIGGTDPNFITWIDSFLYHLSEYVDLTDGNWIEKDIGDRDEIENESFEELLNIDMPRSHGIDLWSCAYHFIILPYLLKDDHIITRRYGQYEAKARVLEKILDRAGNFLRRDPIVVASFHAEIGICWLHTGRLSLSSKHITEAASRLEVDGDASLYMSFSNLRPDSNKDIQVKWRSATMIGSIMASIFIKNGRSLPFITDELNSIFLYSKNIASNYQAYSPTNDGWLESGAIRILYRMAEVSMLRGDNAGALALFERANEISLYARHTTLSGGAARRFAVLLVRMRDVVTDAIYRASQLIDTNLQQLGRIHARWLNRPSPDSWHPSSDIIPFMILKAGLLRVCNERDAAQAMLRDVLEHNFFQHRQCTFTARQEAEIENLKQILAWSGEKMNAGVASSAKQKSNWCINCRQQLLAEDFMILEAIASAGERRDDLLRQLKILAASREHYARFSEISFIEDGKDNMIIFGL